MAFLLRADYAAEPLRAAAKASKDTAQARRLLALASIYDDLSRPETARLEAVAVQIVRDWMVKFNAHGPTEITDCKPQRSVQNCDRHLKSSYWLQSE